MHHVLVTGFLFLSLGLDTFGVAVGLGLSGLDRRAQLRIGVAFALAEGLMPVVGFLLGQQVVRVIGDLASYAAIALLFGAGLYIIWEATHEEDAELYADSPWKLIQLSLSVSMDELAIGFSLGLLGVPVILAVLYIAAQAFGVTLTGIALGRKLSERFAERAELMSGLALTALAIILLGEKLAGT